MSAPAKEHTMMSRDRRDLLRRMGLGAAAGLLGPLAHGLRAEAQGAPAKKRFILFTAGNGFIERSYTCTARSETDFDLNPVLEPLAPHRKDLLVVSKLYNPFDKALHGNQWATLSVVPSPDQKARQFRGPPGGISIDRLIGTKLYSGDPHPSTAIGLYYEGKFLSTSADGPGKPFPALGNPVKAYATYFGNAALPEAGPMPAADDLLAQSRSVLDLVRGDVARLQGRLAAPERAKLDQFTESLRGVERQLTEIVRARSAGTCQPTMPGQDAFGGGLTPPVMSAMVDLTFSLHLCNMTHVSHISYLGFEAPFVRAAWLGDTVGWHNLHHQNKYDIIQKLDRYIIEKVAQMADNLARAQEGGGRMLDRAVVAFLNTCGGRHHTGHDSHAVVLVGGGGALRTGRYLQFPLKQRCMSDLYVPMANAVGLPITTFGAPEHFKGPLPGVLA